MVCNGKSEPMPPLQHWSQLNSRLVRFKLLINVQVAAQQQDKKQGPRVHNNPYLMHTSRSQYEQEIGANTGKNSITFMGSGQPLFGTATSKRAFGTVSSTSTENERKFTYCSLNHPATVMTMSTIKPQSPRQLHEPSCFGVKTRSTSIVHHGNSKSL
jgi:hypothetical protein